MGDDLGCSRVPAARATVTKENGTSRNVYASVDNKCKKEWSKNGNFFADREHNIAIIVSKTARTVYVFIYLFIFRGSNVPGRQLTSARSLGSIRFNRSPDCVWATSRADSRYHFAVPPVRGARNPDSLLADRGSGF